MTNVKSSVNLETIATDLEDMASSNIEHATDPGTPLQQPMLTEEVNPDSPLRWFAVRVRSNHERVASAFLRNSGYEEFLPAYKEQRRWSDRSKEMEQFLFPGYVFCRLDPSQRLPVLKAPGVVDLVGFARVPAPIPDVEIESIRRMVQSSLLVMPWPFLEVGNKVLIERGPLAGVEGILDEVKGKCRLIVSVNLLQRSVSAEVDRSWVRPVAANNGNRSGSAVTRST